MWYITGFSRKCQIKGEKNIEQAATDSIERRVLNVAELCVGIGMGRGLPPFIGGGGILGLP